MDKITFKNQLVVGVGIVVISFILSTLTKQAYFSNIGWIIYGLLFLINPIYPETINIGKYKKIYLRLVGLLIIISAFFIRFGF